MSDLTEPVLLAGLDGISALGVFDLDGRRSVWTEEGLETGLSIGACYSKPDLCSQANYAQVSQLLRCRFVAHVLYFDLASHNS